MEYRHFDPDAVVADLLGNRAALDSVLGIVADWHANTSAELQAAAANDDRPRLARIAHTARGALLQLHARPGVARASELERCCAPDGDAAALHAALAALLAELAALAVEAGACLAQGTAATDRPGSSPLRGRGL